MKKLDTILQEKLQEMHNPNDLAWQQSPDFIKKLHGLKYIDNVFGSPSDEIDPQQFMEELKRMVHEEDDEIEIVFEDNNSITLDVNVAKHLLANCSQEQLVMACENAESMHSLLKDLFEVIHDIDVEDELEDVLNTEDKE